MSALSLTEKAEQRFRKRSTLWSTMVTAECISSLRFKWTMLQKEDSELKSLALTGDFFKKVVVRLDIPHNYYDDNGIFHCNLIDFLLERVELF